MSCGDRTQVQKFYQGCNVFITGGTGFLGKLTIEKILRSCPDVRKVYVLIRPKKGLTVQERKNVMLENVVFERMKQEQPDSVEKIVFMTGDCSEPRLGLSKSDYYDLTQHVNIVLHLAATVRFDEKMAVAINVNIMGALETIKLCQECTSLKAAVFVTTAFSNPFYQKVEEEFYNPPMKIEEVFALMERFNESELETLSHKISGRWKIPYLFSKGVIENIILTKMTGLPVTIVRPSMVISTAREPLPGWLDNMYGPIAIVIGASTGILRVNYGDPNWVLDTIPADFVSNCIITAALTTRSNGDITIYNVATSNWVPLTIRMITDSFMEKRETLPVKQCIWYPFLITISNFKLYTLLTIFLHMFPGLLIDLVLGLKGQPQIAMKIYRKIRKYSIILHQFSLKEMVIVSDNTQKLYQNLEIRDKEIFFFDKIEPKEFITMACIETRKYLLNETLDDLEYARSQLRKLYIIHTVVKLILCSLVIWTVWCLVKPNLTGIFTHSLQHLFF